MFRTPTFPLLLTLLALLAGGLAAQPARTNGRTGPTPELLMPDSLTRATDVLWEDDLPRELAESDSLGIFRRTVWGFSKSALGLELLRLQVTDRGTSGSLERVLLEEIPPGQDVAALVWMPEAASVWLATNPVEGSTEKPKLYRSSFDIDGLPGQFRESKFPEDLIRVGRMRSVDGQLVVLGESGQKDARSVRLFVAPWAGSRLADWASNGERPFRRDRYDLVVFPGLAVIVGGGPEAGSREEMSDARLSLAARFGYPHVGEFQVSVLPLPRPVSHFSAMTAGVHAVATADFAMLARNDPQTSLTLMVTNDIGEGTSTNWRMVPMNAPARRGARILYNQSDTQLLILGGRTLDGSDANTILAFDCPDFANAPTPQQVEEEENRRLLEVAKRQMPELDADRVRESALKKGRYVLTFFPGDGRDGEVALESLSTSSSFRALTMGAYVNRVGPANDKGQSAKYGVSKFPALVLHTANGRVLAVHEGSVPTMEDVFRVTSPIRDPVGTHPDTTAGPNR